MIPITKDTCRARDLAERAYIFAYPMLEHYNTMYIQAIDDKKLAPFNEFRHVKFLIKPGFNQVVTPNNDTLYSTAWLDLRAEPMVLTVPEINRRYYTFQLIDMYTHNFGYVGTRTTGTGAGSYLIVGPNWSGNSDGFDGVFESEGHFVLNLGRTAVDGGSDLLDVYKIQKEYKLQTLSEFSYTKEAPPPSEEITFPVYHQGAASSPRFISYFNFLLGQLEPHPSEVELLQEFGEIGIEAGKIFDPNDYTCEVLGAIQEGICRALRKITQKVDNSTKINGWTMSFGAFGDRAEMQGRYLQRAASAMAALYGNSDAEALYPIAYIDHNGHDLDGRQHQYTLHFEENPISQVDGFWSLSLYDLASQQFVYNEIQRYSIGDRTEDLVYNNDGSLTIYIQEEQPTDEHEQNNWLPTPPERFEVKTLRKDEVVEYDGTFYLVLRLYLPKKSVLNGEWSPPAVTKK